MRVRFTTNDFEPRCSPDRLGLYHLKSIYVDELRCIICNEHLFSVGSTYTRTKLGEHNVIRVDDNNIFVIPPYHRKCREIFEVTISNYVK